MPFRLVARFIIQALRGEGSPPTFAQWRPAFRVRSEASGDNVKQVWTWNPPAEWGDGGSGSREFRVQLRVGSTPGNLTRWPGGIGTRASSPTFEIDPAQVGGYVQLRVRAVNGLGVRQPPAGGGDGGSGYWQSAVTRVAAVESGFLRLSSRYLRVNDGTNWRRLRLP